MGIIQCAEPCEHQNDGYCELNCCGAVCSLKNGCPYFKEKSSDQADRVAQPLNANQLDGFGTGGNLF